MSKENKNRRESDWESPKSNNKKQFFKGKKSAGHSFKEDKPAFAKGRDRRNSKFESKSFKAKDGLEENTSNKFKRKRVGEKPATRDFRTESKKIKPEARDRKPELREGRTENKITNTSPKSGFASKFGRNINTDQKPQSFKEKDLREKLPERIQKRIAKNDTNDIRLNKYIANSGICSRREADVLIETGQISVNGEIITEMGYKVLESDSVKYGKKLLSREKLVYVLLNKPKDFITTTDDPNERKTVMDLVSGAAKERIYPVGRLDRKTTGLLLLTNDGELAAKLSHPSNEIRKIYEVQLDKTFTKEHFEEVLSGLQLEDGEIKADELAIISPDATKVGIEIHSGKNRIIRRLFESLGYEVVKLDRTTYAGLSKKDIGRGNWRYLSEKEIIRLKYLI